MADRFPRHRSPMFEPRLSYQEQRRKLAAFVKAVGADPGGLVRGADLNWVIAGERGDIRPLAQHGYEVFLASASPAGWADAKARLGLFVVKENGVSGIMWLRALPDRDQAATILDLLGIKPAWRGPAPKMAARTDGYSSLARLSR